jgi:hypothetical protein
METEMHTQDRNDVIGLLVAAVVPGFSLRQLATPVRRVETDRAALPIRRRGWLERLDLWFGRARQRDIESYLARSHDVFELERRIRDLERANSSSWPF